MSTSDSFLSDLPAPSQFKKPSQRQMSRIPCLILDSSLTTSRKAEVVSTTCVLEPSPSVNRAPGYTFDEFYRYVPDIPDPSVPDLCVSPANVFPYDHLVSPAVMPTSNKGSTLQSRRGLPKPYIPFQGNLRHGRTTGTLVNYVDCDSDSFKRFSAILKQADKEIENAALDELNFSSDQFEHPGKYSVCRDYENVSSSHAIIYRTHDPSYTFNLSSPSRQCNR